MTARRRLMTATAVVLGLATTVVAIRPASAADNPYQRGPDPTVSSVAATYGPYATAQTTVPAGNGFNGGYIYYPTDTSQGTWGAVAIVPGYTALFANEEAWMGPRLASFGFVVIGIETNSRNDYDTARGTQLLAALDYLTQRSSVRDRVDPNRLAVLGHSMGGGGALSAAQQRPSLKAAIGLAPFKPSGNPTTLRVPTLWQGGQNDTVVTPSYLDSMYPTIPSSTPSAFVQLTGADHLFWTKANTIELRTVIPWLKIFTDNDTRYSQFFCPSLKDTTGVSRYSAKCSLIPSAPSPSPSSSSPSASPSVSPSASPSVSPSASVSVSPSVSPSASPSNPTPAGACTATYRTVNTWSGGFQAEVTVTAGGGGLSGWSVAWVPSSGQSVSQVWNGTLATSGSAVTVTNASYNGSVPAGGSTTFGFLGNGTASTPTLACTSA